MIAITRVRAGSKDYRLKFNTLGRVGPVEFE